MNRREFITKSLAAAIYAQGSELKTPDELSTLTQWMNATPAERERSVKTCLNRIKEMDSSVHAWVQVSPQEPTGSGPLLGIPFGVKDIIETKGLATEFGSPIYKGRIGAADAAIVQHIRKLGGILLGKTQCTPFAYKTPSPTATQETWRIRRVGAPAVRLQRLLREWCLWQLERRREAPCCDQLLSAV